MKKLLLAVTLFSGALNAQTLCEAGFADIYPCHNVDLWRFLDKDALGGATNTNDIWGWTDPNSGREFALVGKDNGTAFVEITNPAIPMYLGSLPTHTTNSLWRDIKVYNNHAFIVSEAGGHGMQVFDLTQLLTVENPPIAFTETAHYGEFGNAHNIVINEDSGYAYAVGTGTFNGGLHIVNIQDPLNPVIAGDYSIDGYTHDAHIVNYHGPDLDYCGLEIAFNSNEDTVTIVNVEDKTDAQTISITPYGNSAYTHQCWLTEDHQYLYVNDEVDELQGLVINTRTLVFDVRDLDNPVLINEHMGVTTSIDHNLYVRSNLIFQSNYRSGLRILDGSKVSNAELSEVGFFDVQPIDDNATFSGTWSNYAYFSSGNVVVTDMYTGLFVLRPRVIDADYLVEVLDDQNDASCSVYINHAAENADVVVSNLPVGVSAQVGTVSAPGDTEIMLTGLEALSPGDYNFSFDITYDGLSVTREAVIRVANEVGYNIALVGPVVGIFQPNGIVLEWTSNFPSGEFVVTLSDQFDMTNIVFETTTSDFSVEVPFNLPDGTYYWSVSGTDICEIAATSTQASFDVLFIGVDEAAQSSFSIFPNPSNEQVTISNTGDSFSFSLYTADGRLVKQGQISGRSQAVLNISDLTAGCYAFVGSNGEAKVIVKQ
ncbi:MAG: choice-of-anchor B family protein [Cryomorphaceae bacterium]|nr:choice-of-anchor B family protein [Cryomorphaceae bacterium]